MKKNYIKPISEVVQVRIQGSILDDVPVVLGSRGGKPEDSFGKENDIIFDDNASGDIWSDPNSDDNAFDLWGE